MCTLVDIRLELGVARGASFSTHRRRPSMISASYPQSITLTTLRGTPSEPK